LAQNVVTNPQAYVAWEEGVTAYSLYVCMDQGLVKLTARWTKFYSSYLWPNASHIQINVVNIYIFK